VPAAGFRFIGSVPIFSPRQVRAKGERISKTFETTSSGKPPTNNSNCWLVVEHLNQSRFSKGLSHSELFKRQEIKTKKLRQKQLALQNLVLGRDHPALSLLKTCIHSSAMDRRSWVQRHRICLGLMTLSPFLLAPISHFSSFIGSPIPSACVLMRAQEHEKTAITSPGTPCPQIAHGEEVAKRFGHLLGPLPGNISLCSHTLGKPGPRIGAAALRDLVLWCGNIQVVPPPWIVETLAQQRLRHWRHSICQPGTPATPWRRPPRRVCIRRLPQHQNPSDCGLYRVRFPLARPAIMSSTERQIAAIGLINFRPRTAT